MNSILGFRDELSTTVGFHGIYCQQIKEILMIDSILKHISNHRTGWRSEFRWWTACHVDWIWRPTKFDVIQREFGHSALASKSSSAFADGSMEIPSTTATVEEILLRWHFNSGKCRLQWIAIKTFGWYQFTTEEKSNIGRCEETPVCFAKELPKASSTRIQRGNQIIHLNYKKIFVFLSPP